MHRRTLTSRRTRQGRWTHDAPPARPARPFGAALAVAVLLAACGGQAAPEDPTGSPGEEPTATPTEPEPTEPSPTDPTPTEEPTEPEPEPHPDLEELVVSPSGLGPLTVGAPPDDNPGSAMITWDPDRCADIAGPGEEPGRWVPVGYGEDASVWGGTTEPFSVSADEDEVGWIDVHGVSIRTEEGVGLGSTLEEVQDAYPDLQGPYDEGGAGLSHVWWVERPEGILVFETSGTDGDIPAGTVGAMRVLAPGSDPQFQTLNTDWVAGGCL